VLTIKRLVNELECSFCQKPKDGCVVEFADQKSGETALCWACLKKMAQMKDRMAQPAHPKHAIPAAPPAVPVNAVPASAK